MPDSNVATTGAAVASTEGEPDKAPYFQYEIRHFKDSEGRRIEMRSLLPGSEDPGPETFQEFTGILTVDIVIAGVSNPVPTRFGIPGAASVMDAFRVFDALAEKAAQMAKDDLESRLRRAQLAAGGEAGMAAGLVGRDGRPLVKLA